MDMVPVPVLLMSKMPSCCCSKHPSAAAQDENGPPTAAKDEDGHPAAAQDEDGPPTAAQDEALRLLPYISMGLRAWGGGGGHST